MNWFRFLSNKHHKQIEFSAHYKQFKKKKRKGTYTIIYTSKAICLLKRLVEKFTGTFVFNYVVWVRLNFLDESRNIHRVSMSLSA